MVPYRLTDEEKGKFWGKCVFPDSNDPPALSPKQVIHFGITLLVLRNFGSPEAAA
jgi:hypothetical protein